MPEPIDSRLARLAEHGRRSARIPAASEIRERGARRRRQRFAAISATAALTVVAGAAAALGGVDALGGQRDARLVAPGTPPAVTQTPDPSPTPSPTRSPARPSAQSPTQSPTTSATSRPIRSSNATPQATPTVTKPAPPPTPADVTRLPDDFAFPEESTQWPERTRFEEFSVTSTRDMDTEWDLDPCSPTAYPTDALRTDFYEATLSGPEHTEVRQVAVYPSAADAHEVMAGFRRVLAACATSNHVEGSQARYQTAELRLGDDALATSQTLYQDFSGENEPPRWAPALGGSYGAVIRVGNAVHLAANYAEWTPQSPVDDRGAKEVRRAAAGTADALCLFNGSCS
ncbi:hypothetical protein BH24ACT13_BH24ACT13_10220 [soil metagenome]